MKSKQSISRITTSEITKTVGVTLVPPKPDALAVVNYALESERLSLLAKAAQMAVELERTAKQLRSMCDKEDLDRIAWCVRQYDGVLATQIDSFVQHHHLVASLIEDSKKVEGA